MSFPRTIIAAIVLVLLGSGFALADGPLLAGLFPSTKQDEKKPAYRPVSQQPSMAEKINSNTKQFFSGAKDALTWNKPAPKKKPTSQSTPWLRPSQNTRKPPQKKSWLTTLFRREEPKRVESMKDWVGLPRPEF